MKQKDNICLYFMQYANRVLLSKLRETSKSRHGVPSSPTYDLGKQPNAHSLKQFGKQTPLEPSRLESTETRSS